MTWVVASSWSYLRHENENRHVESHDSKGQENFLPFKVDVSGEFYLWIKGVVSKETVVLRQWRSCTQEFGFVNGVDNVNWPPYRDSKSWRFEHSMEAEWFRALDFNAVTRFQIALSVLFWVRAWFNSSVILVSTANWSASRQLGFLTLFFHLYYLFHCPRKAPLGSGQLSI